MTDIVSDPREIEIYRTAAVSNWLDQHADKIENCDACMGGFGATWLVVFSDPETEVEFREAFAEELGEIAAWAAYYEANNPFKKDPSPK